MSRTVGVLVMEHIAAGLVEGSKVIGPLKLFPETAQSLDPLQSMPSGDITECIRGLAEKVAGGEKNGGVGLCFFGNNHNQVGGGSPKLQQKEGFRPPTGP